MYKIEIEMCNDYRCCCSYYWENEEKAETLEEALSYFPSLEEEGSRIRSIDGTSPQLVGITVTDAEGREVAKAGATWSWGYEGRRGDAYDYTKWSGYRPGTGSFCRVYKGDTLMKDLTWESIYASKVELSESDV